MTKSIAIVFHRNERIKRLPRFAIWHLAEVWKKENITVFFLFGTEKYVPADLALLHVDLTSVPDEYMDFARRYPVILNGKVKDIRKSTFSKNRVNPDDGYDGKVIVKSELNYGGEPERKLLGTPLSRLASRTAMRMPWLLPSNKGSKLLFRLPSDYRIYNSLRSVPIDWFKRDGVLVEKFLPEIQDGLYCLRNYHFLGDRGGCVLRKSAEPIVNAATASNRQDIDPDPEIVKLTKSLQFDFGKFDYVMHDGKAVLLDANKTPGMGTAPEYFAMCREWAEGIHSYF
jgi:hypothetical protein